MMTEQNIQSLMQYLPEEYLEEAAAFRVAHSISAAESASPKADAPPRLLLRAALPIAAAACLAAVCGLFWWMGSRDDMPMVESRQHEVDEQHTPATQTETTESLAPETSETTDTAASETAAAPAQGSARVTGSAAGTAAQGTGSVKAQGTGAAQNSQNNAKQTATTTKPASNQTAAETEPKLPYDPEIVAQYRLGDVNMDGRIDSMDVWLLTLEYYTVVVDGGESTLTPEQLYLGNVTDERITPEVSLWGDKSALIETDYIISTADIYWLHAYYADIYLGYRDEIPMEVYIEFGADPYIDENGEYGQNYYGDWFIDGTSEDITALHEFGIGTIPAWVSYTQDWNLTGYCYARRWETLTLEYQAADSGLRVTLEYELSATETDKKVAYLEDHPERYALLPTDGDTIWYLDNEEWSWKYLYWLTDGYYTKCGFYIYNSFLTEEYYDYAETFRSVISLD